MDDKYYMNMALELAKKGVGRVNPNPLVGTVIVKNGKVIGKGYHEKYGELHAERNAIKSLTESAEGSTMYVTLEPCCHYGKTPPCTEAILENKIKKVVIGSDDPNVLVRGKGIAYIKAHGVEVVKGVMKEECDEINKIFFHYIINKTPYVMMKYAMTMDGKIACVTGESKWISGEESRLDVMNDRNRFKAIMVGVNTVIKDNPNLTCRLSGGVNPIRIICDTNLKTPLNCNISDTAKDIETIIATCCIDDKKIEKYRNKGLEILKVKKKDGHTDLKDLMIKLGEKKIDSLILEGGAELNYSALEAKIVKKIKVYIAPKIFGGKDAKSAVAGEGVSYPSCAFMFSNSKFKKIGEDIVIESEAKSCLQE
ncbi:bifunctional diaminohydroxyphosphoribosylaminopyrimidine deaminase/5-amino-6-(5-phosphoribosylamino)uracil reductase RibD [Clostridium sp. BJN0001]|uniref:bifunctional diaminohydroxyphosphoribosylaminopyrimidine deaminase/5-amino-6-(5-phosphoribosylamino)uracil reductase RibD n=1 Tax=Clostridium sp. BJN0001 TaxID=2930219 RepID=UPI001FD15F1E|nr:bifunctional diaminohydroxyphosphoribosylaminopyrimidine deaminase/5-amino-6-(5-phosphoribosylamino)uracil reductase RibD [Clostridium sp. BJN0001]